MRAAKYEHVAVVKLLLDYVRGFGPLNGKARIDHRTRDSSTHNLSRSPLSWAAWNGNMAIVFTKTEIGRAVTML